VDSLGGDNNTMPGRRHPLTQLRQRVVDNPFAAVFVFAATIYLAGLPTVYTVLAAGSDPNGGVAAAWRKPAFQLFAVWSVCALVLGGVAFLKDSQLQSLLAVVRSRAPTLVGNRRREAVVRAITLLLDNGREAQLLQRFSPRVFIAAPSEHPTELVPFLSADIRPWQHWPVGVGAIGVTFEANNDDPLVFRRQELAKLNRSLTGEQLEHYNKVTMVAAIVIRDEGNQPLGVLSVSSEEHAPRFGKSRLQALKLLASGLGVFLELMV
jgi:hypothetical protein